MESMKAWLHRCTQNHTACSKTISGESIDHAKAQLPTRCLKIDTLSSGVIKAHLEETFGRSGRYIVLSHHWSPETESSKTTMRNYEDRKSGKQFDLPQIFEDTLVVAQKLGISYVWIDSICIIQDGNEWESECLKIADYYQQSTLMIAAAINTESSGLALSRIPSQLLPRLARLPYRDKSGQEKGFFYLYHCQSVKTLSQAYSKTLETADLLKRGWVFQEWCLSRRIACFASPKPGQRIFFQCQTKNPMNELGYTFPHPKVGFWGKPIRFAARSPLELWKDWQRTVEIYSNLNLSDVQKDRIIALAGVAKEFRAALRSVQLDTNDRFADSYVAGLCLRNIPTGLLWEQRCDDHRQVARKRIAGISTWSWASIMIPVVWNSDMDSATYTCKILGVITESGENYLVENESSTERGPVTQTPTPETFNINNRYSILRLLGRLLPVIIGDDFSNETHERLDGIPGLLSYYETNLIRENFQKREPTIRFANTRKVCPASEPHFICGWGSFEHPNFQDQDAFTTSEIYAMPISKYKDSWSYLDVRNVIFLRKLEDTGSECFERIGVGKIVQGTDKFFASAPEEEIRLC